MVASLDGQVNQFIEALLNVWIALAARDSWLGA